MVAVWGCSSCGSRAPSERLMLNHIYERHARNANAMLLRSEES